MFGDIHDTHNHNDTNDNFENENKHDHEHEDEHDHKHEEYDDKEITAMLIKFSSPMNIIQFPKTNK